MAGNRIFPLLGLIVVATSAGCKSEPSSRDTQPGSTGSAEPTKATPTSVTVTAKDYQFDAPDTIPAGVVTIDLVNRGKELHQAQMIKLEDGKTADDVTKALQTPGPPPSWIKFVGGPNGIAPGAEAHETSVLAPGSYAFLCLIPSPDGRMHASKGMIRPFQVTGSAPGSSELPQGDVTMTLSDYSFTLSQPLTPGQHTIMVTNSGPQPHEVVLLRLAPGKQVEDFANWAETMKGPPPAEPLGGVTLLDKGGRGTFTADLKPGTYGLICFVPDAKDGKPHFTHGMMKTIKVG
jgi:uncharacterized cupredoxin-like copper-binding protein